MNMTPVNRVLELAKLLYGNSLRPDMQLFCDLREEQGDQVARDALS